MGIVILLPLFLLMYFMMIRPQQRAKQQFAEMQRTIEVGDQVVTSGGIYGNIVQIDDDAVWVEIAPDTEIKLARGAITRKLPPSEVEATDAYEAPDTTDDYTGPADSDDGTAARPVDGRADD